MNATDRAPLQILFEALVAYGRDSTPPQVHRIQAAYEAVLELAPAEGRRGLWRRLKTLVETQQINSNPFLAMAICEPEMGIAASCALDFVCYSGLDEQGRNLGVLEFMRLFPTGAVTNRGAVFGGLLALGDRSLSEVYQTLTPCLTVEDVRAASIACASGRLFHATIDYWLTFLDRTIESDDPATLSAVGHAAAALVRLHKAAAEPRIVMDSYRLYPAFEHPDPVQTTAYWPLDDYARAIAPHLGDLAAREPPPCIMREVLAVWSATHD